jgi:hypothetical protein
MSRKRINFKYRKERSLLSDVLPYEVPITFTNRHFYDFLLTHHVEYKDGNISWKVGDKALDEIIHLIFGLPKNENRLSSEDRSIGIKKTKFNMYALVGKGGKPCPSLALIPFGYKINHKQSEFRELTVLHPRSQIDVVNFYDTCKETILYYCSQSSFSIRKPSKIAKYKFHKDRTHYEKLADDLPVIESLNKEYENLRSFFVYMKYSNIYKFYESYQFHRCEKKYNTLLKLDVSKCFDSIYTHSLSWAILGKPVVKENLLESNKTFSGRFDKLMQNMNYNETNGIIIGPEFSRIFAELILQSIDKKLECDLQNIKHPLKNKVDYEIFRYVDDYFIFYNEEHEKKEIVDALQHSLKEYKLHLNSAKAIVYEKPIITEISRAKQQIAQFLEEKLTYKLENISPADDDDVIIKGSIYINSNKLITRFKTIIKECNVEYKDMLNYSLATTENKCEKILKNYNKANSENRSQKQTIQAIIAILEFVFFIYSVSPRVNTTIRLCRILRIFCSFLKSQSINSENKHLIYKCIYDNIYFILKKNKSSEHTQVETLYLLTTLPELGKDYWLEQDVLADYFGIRKTNDIDEYNSCTELNYFSFTVILFYMREKVRYKELREFIEKSIVESFVKKSATLRKDAEATMLFFDVMSCPFISIEAKIKILEKYEITDNSRQEEILNFKNKNNSKQLWFTTWQNFDFGKELDTKHSQEVY